MNKEIFDIIFKLPSDPSDNSRDFAWDRICKESSKEEILNTIASVFENLELIEKAYGGVALESGLWFVFGDPLEDCLEIDEEERANHSESLSSARVRLFRGFEATYSKFLVQNPRNELETCFQMLWDMVLTKFWDKAGHSNTQVVSFDGYKHLPQIERRTLDLIFSILKKLLEINDPAVLLCVLHGFGHLHHPESEETVTTFVEQHREKIADFDPVWIEECKKGVCQ